MTESTQTSTAQNVPLEAQVPPTDPDQTTGADGGSSGGGTTNPGGVTPDGGKGPHS